MKTSLKTLAARRGLASSPSIWHYTASPSELLHRRRAEASTATAVLHTWSRDLSFHPHLHCIVTGGGLSLDRARWVEGCRGYLFPVKALGALFRGKLLAALT